MAFVILIVVGYEKWGLLGTGIAVTVAHVFDYLLINGFAYIKYGYRMSVTVIRYASVQLALGFVAYATTLLLDGFAYWVSGLLLMLLSLFHSLHILRQKTHLWEALTRRFRKG